MPSAPLAIDRVMPAFDTVIRRHLVVGAPPPPALAAATGIDLAAVGRSDRVMRPLFAVRAALDRAARCRDEADEPGGAEFARLADLPPRGEWVALGGEPEFEFAFGAVGRFWGPRVEFDVVDAEEFALLWPPGRAKIAASLQARPYGAASSLLTYEVRTMATDEGSRRGFRRYWAVVRPLVGWTMSRVLVAVARRVEGAGGAPEAPASGSDSGASDEPA